MEKSKENPLEDLLQRISDDYVEQIASDIPHEVEPHVFSPEFEKNMNLLIKKKLR